MNKRLRPKKTTGKYGIKKAKIAGKGWEIKGIRKAQHSFKSGLIEAGVTPKLATNIANVNKTLLKEKLKNGQEADYAYYNLGKTVGKGFLKEKKK